MPRSVSALWGEPGDSGLWAWIIPLTVLLIASSIYWYLCESRGKRTSRLLYPAIACVLLTPLPLMIIIVVMVGGSPYGAGE